MPVSTAAGYWRSTTHTRTGLAGQPERGAQHQRAHRRLAPGEPYLTVIVDGKAIVRSTRGIPQTLLQLWRKEPDDGAHFVDDHSLRMRNADSSQPPTCRRGCHCLLRKSGSSMNAGVTVSKSTWTSNAVVPHRQRRSVMPAWSGDHSRMAATASRLADFQQAWGDDLDRPRSGPAPEVSTQGTGHRHAAEGQPKRPRPIGWRLRRSDPPDAERGAVV